MAGLSGEELLSTTITSACIFIESAILRHCNSLRRARKKQRTLSEEDSARSSFLSLWLSARAYDRILKVARTIADLEGSVTVRQQHIMEGIG